jgi:DNA-binding protein YbaB
MAVNVALQEDPLKNEIISAVKKITVRVESIESALAKMEDFNGSLSRKGISCEIEAGMGTVIVDGHGQLVRVRLDADTFGTGDTPQLGARIVTAIRTAQDEAKRAQDLRIDELAREMWQ